MSRYPLALAVLMLVAGRASAQAQDGLLLHYACNEGQGKVVADDSANKLNGAVSAAWAPSPSGQALSFDGQPAGIVRVQLPVDKRFGKGSWTFSAWLKPTRFTIDDRQNQRRIFAFGAYPEANLVIDLTDTGVVTSYFCYRNPAGTIVPAGSSSATGLALGQWGHVALVVDRQAGRVESYINGFSQGATNLPAGFDGDFSLGGELTLGSGWHNYWGLMDEVCVYRRALSRAEVKTEFSRLKDTFGVRISPQAAAAERREAVMESFATSHAAWAKGDWAAVRAACAAVYQSAELPGSLRSYAHLRAAQSYVAEGNPRAASAEYTLVTANAVYPDVHRAEAFECMHELDRVSQGLPARDPAATRVKVPAIDKFEAEVFVSPQGNDANDGERKPVATLTRARDLVRAQRAKGVKGAIAVNILPGEYHLTGPFALTNQDSGNAAGPVVYRAVEPGKARFYGGQRLKGFAPVTDAGILARLPKDSRGRVVRCDLKVLGITDFGQLAVRGFAQPPAPPTLEVFVNGQAMTLARWPNTGFVSIRKLVEPGDRRQKKPSVFEYLDERHARWTQAEDVWLFGYFRYLWADATIKVTKIDPQTHTVTCGEAYQYGEPGMDTGQGIQYYAFNLLEEIDQPGEWYLDRKAGVLYLYPPCDLARATVDIGMLPTPMVTAEQVSDVRFEGLTFDLGRASGMVLNKCNRLLVAGCTVSRMAGNGITVNGGTANGLLGCDIHTIGRRATEVIGGDRATLTPGRHFVENCRIHDFGRIDRTYTPAIQLEGVGNRVAHNLMYDCPSSVMRIEGNDHVIEYNDIHSAVRESDDQGAIDIYANPSYRGIVFRHNRFVNCGKAGVGASVHGQAAIRFDDAISGMLVYGNVFVRSANGNFGTVQMNSGRDNIIDNNLFVDCKQGISGGWAPGNGVWREIAASKKPADVITSDLYLKRYPLIATMMDSPGINHVWRNVFYRSGPLATGNRANLDLIENGVFADKNPGFVNPEAGDFRLRADSELRRTVGFRPIPVDEIGLYK